MSKWKTIIIHWSKALELGLESLDQITFLNPNMTAGEIGTAHLLLWCEMNCTDRYKAKQPKYPFENRIHFKFKANDDAMLFKLTFGGK